MDEHPAGFDDLRVRFVFVPDGAPVPWDWMADWTDIVRVPATLVWRYAAKEESGHQEIARVGRPRTYSSVPDQQSVAMSSIAPRRQAPRRAPSEFRQAQELFPFLSEESPLLARPPVESFPKDPTKPPAPGFEWKGSPGSEPGSSHGNWHNPQTRESLRPDLHHAEPHGPHYDYRAPDGRWYRWLPDDRMVPKGKR